MLASNDLKQTHPGHAADFHKALFDHALDAVLISDDSGFYVEANRAACELMVCPVRRSSAIA